MPGEKAPPQSPYLGCRLRPAIERDPRPLQRVGERARLVDQNGSAGVGGEICGVARERGNEESGSAGNIRPQA